MKKPNFMITFRYKILTFLSVGPFFEEGVGGPEMSARSKNFKDFSIEVDPKRSHQKPGYFGTFMSVKS